MAAPTGPMDVDEGSERQERGQTEHRDVKKESKEEEPQEGDGGMRELPGDQARALRTMSHSAVVKAVDAAHAEVNEEQSVADTSDQLWISWWIQSSASHLKGVFGRLKPELEKSRDSVRSLLVGGHAHVQNGLIGGGWWSGCKRSKTR